MPPSPSSSAARRGGRSRPSVSIVIPVLNEESTLPLVLDGLPPVDEVVVVDGGSADGTVAAARAARPDVIVVRQTRTGKGNALVCGFLASSGDLVITLDATGRADPGEVVRHVRALEAGAEATHGSRYRAGGGDVTGRGTDRLGNRALCRLANLLFGTRFTDLGSGFNGFWRESFTALDLPAPDLSRVGRGRSLPGDGPEIEPLITLRMAAQGLRVVEVACTEYPPIHGERRRRRLRRTIRALRTLLSEWSRRRRLARRPSLPARHDAATHPGYATAAYRPGEGPRPSRTGGRPTLPAPRSVRPSTPDNAAYVAGERTTGRHAAATQGAGTHDLGARRSGIYETAGGIEPGESGVHRTGVYDTAVRRSGLYDTGVHRLGVYDSGVHRTDVYDSGVHELPEAPREVGGGRRRLDASDRRTET